MMFTNPHNPSGDFRWVDSTHGQVIPAKIMNNRHGFAMREEVDFSRMRPKAGKERVVILTGGSTAWGVGATSNDTTVAGRLQSILNENVSEFHYTVLNLAMGGWTSVQQLIALALFGRNLQPDWIVGMDGLNDAAVACAHSQGAGYPLYYGLMEAYIKAYVFGQLKPVFYRGWLENELIKRSVAYRKLSGQTPIIVDVMLDTRDPSTGRSVIRQTTWADVEQALELYVQTESEMIDLFPRAKAILGTQPLPFNFEEMFGRVYQQRGTGTEASSLIELKTRLAEIAASAKDKGCGLEQFGSNARRWFMPSASLRLETLAEQYRTTGRSVQYLNTGALFPNLTVNREDYFIDPAHLNDAGMDVIARVYAGMILATDLPERFTLPQWTGRSLPDPPIQSPDEIHVVEATYGLSCMGVSVSAPAQNLVTIGNASDAVARKCRHQRGKCDFLVDVAHLGNPANTCAKDFSVKWRCGTEDEMLQNHIPGEANGKTIALTCAAAK
jgi:lysophospholipase L1-like esterase